MGIWYNIRSSELGGMMGLSEFSIVTDSKEYTLYKWHLQFKRYVTTSFKISSKDYLKLLFKFVGAVSEYKDFIHTIVFYNANGNVYTLTPKSKSFYSDCNTFLKEDLCSEVLWVDLPQIFPVLSDQIEVVYGLGQVVYNPDYSIATPLIEVSSIKGVVRSRRNRVKLVTVKNYTQILEDISLRFRVLYYSMYSNGFGSFVDYCGIDKQFDKIRNFSDLDKSVKYCIREMSVLLYGITDEEATVINRCLYNTNADIFTFTYPLEYKLEKVNSVWQLTYYIYENKGYDIGRLTMNG